MKYVITHYMGDPSWIKKYTDDWLIYDRSDQPLDWPNTRRVPNLGNADYDRLSFIVESYDDLPEVFLLAKSNLIPKYISKEEFDAVKDNEKFTPLLTKNHPVYSDILGTVCFYKDGIYWERNDSWYLQEQPARYFNNFDQWCVEFGLPREPYIPFAPGGNYILTKEVVHRHSKEYYDRMRETLPYTITPGEAQMVERSLFYLWR